MAGCYEADGDDLVLRPPGLDMSCGRASPLQAYYSPDLQESRARIVHSAWDYADQQVLTAKLRTNGEPWIVGDSRP